MRRDERDDSSPITPRTVGIAVAVILALVFIAENTARTEIRFIVPKVESPLWVALLVTFVVGAGAGWLAARSRRD